MKKYTPSVAVCLCLIMLASCDNGGEQTAAPSVLPATLNPISTVGSDTVAASGNSSALVLNPKHGEPGHRCDIAVGAPLNSPAAGSSTQSTTTSNPASTPVKPPAEVPDLNATNAKLNPKHGEPGHRCDIAVGAPLNSKPAQ